MNVPVRALDVSAWSGRTSAQWWRDRKAEGCELAIPGAWHGNSTNPFVRDQMGFAYDTGMMLAIYIALSQWHSGDEQVAEGRYACGEFWPQLRFVALDMELPGLEPLDLSYAQKEVGLPDSRIPTYTRYWWWEPWVNEHIANSVPEFLGWPNNPAWVAYYDGRASLDAAPIITGGPIRPLAPLTGLGPIIGKQYAGSVKLDGIVADLNVFQREFIEGGDMGNTPEQWAAGWARVERDVARIKAAWPHTDEEKADPERNEEERLSWQLFWDNQFVKVPRRQWINR